jgi:catechol 2,3-dioxygenase-like lactoylglutathione lyase family enzyme
MVLDQGTCRIYHIASSGYLGFCQCERLLDAHEDIIFTLVTFEVDRWHKYLQSKGVFIEKPPTHNPTYNIYHLTFRDPNGYLLEIQQFDDPAWDEAER